MIQLIFEYKDIDVLKEVSGDFEIPVIVVPEMLEDMYLTLIEANRVTALEDTLKQPPLKMTFVGTYNIDGSQHIWTEPTEIERNHSISKYKNKLKNGNDYTDEEAKQVQVNKIYGYNDREL